MKMNIPLLLVSLSLLAVTNALVGCPCANDEECKVGECCQILTSTNIASKKRFAAFTGTCQRYKTLGETCDHYEQSYGYCGCGPGFYCDTFQVKLKYRSGYKYVSQCKAFNTYTNTVPMVLSK